MTEHDTLAPALVAALADLTVVEKGRTAKIKTNKGADYSYDYAAIEDVIKLTRPALAAHGIIALTPIHAHDKGLACTVTLLHTSGERLDLGPFPFPDGRDAQTTGSMVTYHRRYALVAALGMAAGDDDDGAAASAPPARKAEPVQAEGVSVEDAGERLRSKLTELDVAGDVVEHAKAVWRRVKPKTAVDGLIYESEMTRLLTEAETYANEPAEDPLEKASAAAREAANK